MRASMANIWSDAAENPSRNLTEAPMSRRNALPIRKNSAPQCGAMIYVVFNVFSSRAASDLTTNPQICRGLYLRHNESVEKLGFKWFAERGRIDFFAAPDLGAIPGT